MQFLSTHRWLRRLVFAVLIVLALWLLSWLAVPHLLRSQGQKLASEALGRQVTIGRVEFAPWSLELTLHDLAVAGRDGQPSQLEIRRIYIDAEVQSLLRLAPVLDAVEVEAPVLRVAQTAPGEYDFDDIVQRLMQPEPEPPADKAPLRFALYNMALRDGSIDFEDRTVGRTHTVRDLELSLPFLSSLASKREIKVEPHLAFVLNGSRFDSATEATPFLESRKTDAHVRLAGFDLAPYLAYVPKSIPMRVQAGVLDVDLRIGFEQHPETSVHLQGSVRAQGLRLADAGAQPLLALESLDVEVADLEPLAHRGRIASVGLKGLHVKAQRSRDGLINWAQLAVGQADATAPTVAKMPVSAPSAGPNAVPTTPATPPAAWALVVDRVRVQGGAVDWADEAVPGGARLALSDLELQAGEIALPFDKPLWFTGQAKLSGDSAGREAARIALKGQATDRMASAAISLDGASLALAAPYIAEHLSPQLTGQIQADLGVAWNGPALVVQLAALSLSDVALSCPAKGDCAGAGLPGVAMRGKSSLAEWKSLRVENAQIDLLRRAVQVERVVLTQPRAMVSRDPHGRWMAEHWQVSGAQPPEAAKHAAAAQARKNDAPWAVQLGAIEVDAGSLAFRDAQPATPVALNVSSLRLRLQDFAPLVTKGAKPSPLSLSARIGAGRADPGRLEYDGAVGLAPLAAQGRVHAVQLPLHAFEPYLADLLNVRVLRADGSFKGQVEFVQADAGPSVRVRGDASLDDLRVRSALLANRSTGSAGGTAGADVAEGRSLALQDDLLHWKSLGLRGVDVAMAPGTATQVEVRETALSDFFARVIVQESGRINLQDVLKASAEAPPVGPVVQTAATPQTAVAAQAPAGKALAPVVRFGPVSLTGGNVRFSDYFIRPNYSADLSELTGRLSAFSSVAPAAGGAPDMADLELRGRAEGTASLEITGKLNPLVQPLALDIEGKMRDLELPPLSPYTVKYAGHGIERGKLSMDVAYKIQPDGQLTARNKLVLNQLTFGEPVQGAPASLPVRLAVALLADRNGVIDLDLPLSGSLNDPEFRLAPVIFKIIGNVIMKAVTAPFSLLMGAFGGGDDSNAVNFAPGSAVLDGAAREALDKVAKALIERPALKLTVVGEAQLEAEREGWKQAQLQRLLLAQKRRATVRGGGSAAEVLETTRAEETELLKAVYRRADIPKPRNLVGMAKELPPAEMQALLLASISVPDEAMQELAVARGVAVRDYLAERQVALDRLFLGAAKSQVKDSDWKPRAQFTLSSQ